MKVRFRPLFPADLWTVRQFMPFSPNSSTRGIVAYDEKTSNTLAIFMAQDWTKTSAQVHQIILNPFVIRHGWFEEIADYVFNRANMLKLYGLVPDNNPRALSVNEKCGFTEKARLENAYDYGVDYIVMELDRENCPYWHVSEQAEVING